MVATSLVCIGNLGDLGFDNSEEPVGYQGRLQRLLSMQLKPREIRCCKPESNCQGPRLNPGSSGASSSGGPTAEARKYCLRLSFRSGCLALPSHASHSRDLSNWGLQHFHFPQLPSLCPSTGVHLVYTCYQKQDAGSEKGAATEAGRVINREKTAVQREGARNPERERVETPRLGETETQSEGDRHSEKD